MNVKISVFLIYCVETIMYLLLYNLLDCNFKNIGKRSTARNFHTVSLLSVVSKVFEKLVNNRIVDHLKKCGLFSDFQYCFRYS